MSENLTGQERTEEENAQAMYAAMAEYMQEEKGMEVSPDEVQDLVETLSAENAEIEPSEKEQEMLEAMADYQAEYLKANPIYVVRGALLYCECGSHCRRLNLPKCHGVYVLKHAQMHRNDCVGGAEGAEFNITSFGICNSPDNKSGGNVTLIKEAPRDPYGAFTGEETNDTISGIPCVPEIVGMWEDPHFDTLIGAEKEPALTTQSYLVCAHKGIIRVWRSGQEDED